MGSGTIQPRIVIVGAGFGGLRAARALGRTRARVTVIDRNNHHLFQPLLYQVATAGLSPADISAPIRGVLRRQRNTDVLLAEVTGVDMQRREVVAQSRADGQPMRIPYDYLVLATGAGQSYFGHDEWEPFAPGLKSIEDATELRRKILLAFEAAEAEMATDPQKAQARLTFVIVGGGPTGVELAGTIAEVARKSLVRDFRHINPASARILLVEAMPRLLATFPPSLAKRVERKLGKLGVEVRTNTRVTNIDDGGVYLDGKRLAAQTVVWAAGVRASPAGAWLGTETDRAGRVLVNGDLSVPGHPEVFVIGDTATVTTARTPLPGIAPVALQEGHYVAEAIQARIAGKPVAPFHYFDKGTLATVGRAYAIADIRGLLLSGFFAWLTWMAVHIFFLIGFRNRILVMFQWAWAYLTYQRGARLITNIASEPATEHAPTEPARREA
ncbi:MAG TPA: NAD(P)/FAD-dependent oxidoreductase [Ktedonobacterales bacterium]|nr:NAD(P)/FAD-dependent oxidoreductase [Ktedonobacterales bacterium]